MTPPADTARYKHHRFPGEIISHGVWLYYRFPLSLLCGRHCQALMSAVGLCLSRPVLSWGALDPGTQSGSVHE